MLSGLLGTSPTMPRPLRRCFRAMINGWLDVEADGVRVDGILWPQVADYAGGSAKKTLRSGSQGPKSSVRAQNIR
jgi:hypothetical protein